MVSDVVQRGGGPQLSKQPWEVFDEEILPYLSAESLFGDLPLLNRDGNFWQARCPIHGDDERSTFSINPERLEWNCDLGCGGGGPVQYLQKVRGLPWMYAARELALLAAVDPTVLEPWQGRWTAEDFKRHQRLEQRSSLLGMFVAYTHSIFTSSAGETIRHYLAERRGFPEGC